MPDEITIPTPIELQVAYQKAQEPDPEALRRALKCIAGNLTTCYPEQTSIQFLYETNSEWLEENMFDAIKAKLNASGWDVERSGSGPGRRGFRVSMTPVRKATP